MELGCYFSLNSNMINNVKNREKLDMLKLLSEVIEWLLWHTMMN